MLLGGLSFDYEWIFAGTLFARPLLPPRVSAGCMFFCDICHILILDVDDTLNDCITRPWSLDTVYHSYSYSYTSMLNISRCLLSSLISLNWNWNGSNVSTTSSQSSKYCVYPLSSSSRSPYSAIMLELRPKSSTSK